MESRNRRVTIQTAERRTENIVAGFDELKLDALLVSHLTNIRYLTGFTGSNALLLVARDRAVLFTDPRYSIQAPEETGLRVIVAKKSLLEAAVKFIQSHRIHRIGFEKACVSYESYQLLDGRLPLGYSLVPLSGVVERLRLIKSGHEIELIRSAVLTTAKAFARAIKRARPGVRESDLAAEIDFQLRKLGAEKSAFETIVASGPRSALPHARPTSKVFASNELLLIDMGACRQGYASDMTRMAFLGRPGARVKKLYRAVLEAQLAAIAAVREGVSAAEIDRRARRVLRAEKLDHAFVHSTGHGLGLDIHESPRLGKRERSRLQAGMVITIEPGVYLQGFGGIRIEDTVVVKARGCEVLTPTPKELLEL